MSKIPPVHLLLGPENGEKSEYLEELRARIAKDLNAEPDQHTFYPFDSSMRDVVTMLRTPGLFSGHTVVIVYNAEQIKKQAEITPLLEYLKKPSLNGTLILVSDEHRVEKKIEQQVPSAARKIFWEMFENQKAGWLAGYFRKKGASITAEAVSLLLDLVENSTDALRREADRLCLFFGKNARITEDDIDRYIYHSKEENVFTLFEQVAGREFEFSLEILQKLLLSGEGNPVQILAGLGWQFRTLYLLRLARDDGQEFNAACSALRIRSKKNQATYASGLKNYDAQALERILRLVTEVDVSLRSSRPAVHTGLLQDLVYSVVLKSGYAPVSSASAV